MTYRTATVPVHRALKGCKRCATARPILLSSWSALTTYCMIAGDGELTVRRRRQRLKCSSRCRCLRLGAFIIFWYDLLTGSLKAFLLHSFSPFMRPIWINDWQRFLSTELLLITSIWRRVAPPRRHNYNSMHEPASRVHGALKCSILSILDYGAISLWDDTSEHAAVSCVTYTSLFARRW